jgi:cytochrome c peroxidase
MSNEFAANGITSGASTDHGRYRITGTPNDSDRFQIPSLRNLSYTYPYMHDGRFKRLQDVINHYSDGKYRESASDPRLRSIAVLDGKEKIDLLAFLLTLNDRQFLFNPAHQDPHAYSLRNQQQSKTIR